ncbi:transporter substrate-binding domain-containing protein [Acidisphaera rubrifaciens]|uniref:Urea short-chain amide or branched-chain amino acid transporter periplasmic substrate-binding protein n=1 Tax=Acidisphaera rubrifaciens HS-AP3 TaxID=1231350 RepID=A0A0D6P7H3_9PROT|nr:transporter substrate-binding domain-containing protein [Acidisphaera rubrifaciens]GAN77148.1 urea short-chain amide or branched-chain amino acid transporter periplasmic substrate-binding protein [Acidisphaera rubrifaciens HS-AP3]
MTAGRLAGSSRHGEPWRVGVLFSQTGVTAVVEETQLRGTLLALSEINEAGGIAGCEVVPVIYDPQSNDRNFARLSHRLLANDGVNVIFGCYTSSSRKAVLPVVERLNGLLLYPTLYEGFELSPNVIYTGAAPNQNLMELCAYLLAHYGPRFHLIGSDYVYPRATNQLMREVLADSGGVLTGETYISLNADRRDLVPVIAELRRTRPDVVFSTVVGDPTIHLYQAYADAGFDPRLMPIASLTTTEAEVRAMGCAVAEGHITAAPYFQSVDCVANTEFVRRYQRRYGSDEPTNMCVEAAYYQVHMFARALAQTRTIETDVLREKMLGATFEAPQGLVEINAASSHTTLWTRIGRATRSGQFEVIRQSARPVVADPYLVGYGRTAPHA